MPGDKSLIALSIRSMHLKSIPGAGSHRFNKNFRKFAIEASILLTLFRNMAEKKLKTQEATDDS
jgi:hypothetical protein